MPHPWALPTALLVTTFGNVLGIYTLVSLFAAARMFVFDLELSPIDPTLENKAL